MGGVKIEIGKSFGAWTPVEFLGQRNWRCVCACGGQGILRTDALRSGRRSECRQCSNARGLRRTHGSAGSRLYNIWSCMKARCCNPNSPAYRLYGARDISVCHEWRGNFVAFRDWAMAHGYTDNLSIDRIDNDGNYEPSNCRWATQKQQARNSSKVRLLQFRGEPTPLTVVAETVGLTPATIKLRLRRGWSVDRACSEPSRRQSA